MKIIGEYRHIRLNESPEDLKLYIYTDRANWFTLEAEIKKEFTSDIFQYYVKNGTAYVHYNPLSIDFKVIPQKIPQMSSIEGTGKYTLTFLHPILDFKWNWNKQEKYERAYKEIISRLPEKMRVDVSWAFNGQEVTVFRRVIYRALRLKKRRKY